jgi:hypothetical protein
MSEFERSAPPFPSTSFFTCKLHNNHSILGCGSASLDPNPAFHSNADPEWECRSSRAKMSQKNIKKLRSPLRRPRNKQIAILNKNKNKIFHS